MASVAGDGHGASRLHDAGQYSTAYERLRACVVGETEPLPRARCAVGLGLVLQQGIPAWLKAHADARSAMERGSTTAYDARTVDTDRPRARTAAVAVATDIVPLARQPDLTLLLASMVVSTQRAGRARAASASRCLTRGKEGVAHQ